MARVDTLILDNDWTLVDGNITSSVFPYILMSLEKNGDFLNYLKYLKLKYLNQPVLWFKVLANGGDDAFEYYGDNLLKGTSQKTFQKAVEIVADREKDLNAYFPDWLKDAAMTEGMIGDKLSKVISGNIDEELVNLVVAAREQGVRTEIYTRSMVQMLNPYLERMRKRMYFDDVTGNKIIFTNGVISGMDHAVSRGKPEFPGYLKKRKINPDRASLIDNDNEAALDAVKIGIIPPYADDEFKEKCLSRQYNRAIPVPVGFDESKMRDGKAIYVPENWDEVYKLLGL